MKAGAMSTDWREKEREFLTSLPADTGRDLAQWMRVIAAQNLPHRNDIIDWLRQQGFLFAKASWLERIHNNGGHPIYLTLEDLLSNNDAEIAEVLEEEIIEQRVAAGGGGANTTFAATAAIAPNQPDVPASVKPESRLRAVPPTKTAVELPAEPVPPSPTSAAAQEQRLPPMPAAGKPGTASLSREDVLAKGKAYRPLATHLLRMVEGAIPDLEINPGTSHLSLVRGGKPFGLIAVSGKDIRLVLRLTTSRVVSETWGGVKLPVSLSRAAEGMSAMVVLTDARQLNDALINHVKAAAGV